MAGSPPWRDLDDSSSFTGSIFTTSSSSTVPGPGAITGKFLKTVGEKSLDLVVSIIIRRRLGEIERTLVKKSHILRNPTGEKESAMMNRIYTDLHELCRESQSEYYSLSVQKTAARLIQEITWITQPAPESFFAGPATASPTNEQWEALLARVQRRRELLMLPQVMPARNPGRPGWISYFAGSFPPRKSRGWIDSLRRRDEPEVVSENSGETFDRQFSLDVVGNIYDFDEEHSVPDDDDRRNNGDAASGDHVDQADDNGSSLLLIPDNDTDDDDTSSSLSVPNDNIDFDLVYALHTFDATVEGQVNVYKGDSLFLMDESDSYWWLVRVLGSQDVGYIPAENVETPFERLARLNKHRNVDYTSPTREEMQEDDRTPNDRFRGLVSPSSQQKLKNRKSVVFTGASTYSYPPQIWEDEDLREDDEQGADSEDNEGYYL